MVTGDNRLAAHAVARQLGIAPEFVMSEVNLFLFSYILSSVLPEPFAPASARVPKAA